MAVVAAALGVLASACSGATPVTGTGVVSLSELDRATTPTSFVLVIDVEDATSAKLHIDANYVGKDAKQPLTFRVKVAPGEHSLSVRSVIEGAERRTDVAFTASNTKSVPSSGSPVSRVLDPTAPTATTDPAHGAAAPTNAAGAVTRTRDSTATATSSPSSTVATSLPTIDTPTTSVAPPRAGDTQLDSVEGIRAALSSAHPGQVLRIADGEYTFKPRLVASASGTATAPITLRGSRNVILRTKNASGDYGLHITGDYWRVEGITVAHASKGIVLDGSIGTVIDGVEIYDIGAEAVHFRMCSSDGVLRNSHVHHTGRTSAQFGEGVYVGSANSNWTQYQCTDHLEGKTLGDNTERVLIEDNVFEDVPAEGADLKEGTDSGILRRNTFRRTGASGQNSADSAVDVKGNNWLIEDNVVSETDAPWDDDGVARPSEFVDGYQSHKVFESYGTRNVFRRNQVLGAVAGFGIGLYPAAGNVVTCDNVATGAVKGLVGNNSKATLCQG